MTARMVTMRRDFLWLSCLVLSTAGAHQCYAENWPAFRGPTGLGYSSEKGLPVTWGGPQNTNILWKSAIKGQGHASPIVWGDRVFICTVWFAPDGVANTKVMPEHYVTCYGAGDGKMLWQTKVQPGPWLRSDFRSGAGGGYAGPTPATDGKLVYCLFGSSVLAALDFDGKIVWRKEIIPPSFDVTVGGSPVLYGNTVLVLCAMAKPEDSKVIAFDKSTGDVKWEHKMPQMHFAHSTPVMIEVNGEKQLLVLASGIKPAEDALQALDPSDGHRIWWCRGSGDSASPAFGAGIVYFDSGRGGLGVAVDPTGVGDVSKTNVRWTVPQVPQGISSPIIVGPYVYRLHAPGILKCWEAASGKEIYSERLDGIASVWASPIADADGHLYFATAGKSYVVEAGTKFKVVAVNDLGETNHPSLAASGGKLFILGTEHLWCIGGS